MITMIYYLPLRIRGTMVQLHIKFPPVHSWPENLDKIQAFVQKGIHNTNKQ